MVTVQAPASSITVPAIPNTVTVTAQPSPPVTVTVSATVHPESDTLTSLVVIPVTLSTTASPSAPTNPLRGVNESTGDSNLLSVIPETPKGYIVIVKTETVTTTVTAFSTVSV